MVARITIDEAETQYAFGDSEWASQSIIEAPDTVMSVDESGVAHA